METKIVDEETGIWIPDIPRNREILQRIRNCTDEELESLHSEVEFCASIEQLMQIGFDTPFTSGTTAIVTLKYIKHEIKRRKKRVH